MKPSARQRQHRGERKRARRRARKAKAAPMLKTPCPRCGYPTPSMQSGGFVRCTLCGSVKG
jgi:transcription elongation factor Elf1